MRKRPRKGQPEERSPNRRGGALPGLPRPTGARIVRHGEDVSETSARAPVSAPPVSSRSATGAIRRLKPLGAPRRVQVVTDPSGAPLRVSPGRSWRSVLSVRERWRIDDEWWRQTLSREYFEVVLQDGRIVELYRDLEKDTWYAHGGGSAFSDRS